MIQYWQKKVDSMFTRLAFTQKARKRPEPGEYDPAAHNRQVDEELAPVNKYLRTFFPFGIIDSADSTAC